MAASFAPAESFNNLHGKYAPIDWGSNQDSTAGAERVG